MNTLVRTLAAAGVMLAVGAPAAAHDYTVGDITVGHPWMRPPIADRDVASAYLTIENAGEAGDRLIAATSTAVETIELHTHIDDDGVMRMRPVEAIDAPAGETVALEQGGLHLMLFGVDAELGDLIPVTLTFEAAGSVDVAVLVEDGSHHEHGEHDHDHDGHDHDHDHDHGDHDHGDHDHGDHDHDAHDHADDATHDAHDHDDHADHAGHDDHAEHGGHGEHVHFAAPGADPMTSLHVGHVWVKPTLGSRDVTAAYALLHNLSDAEDRLISASSPVAETVELHTHEQDGDIMRMRKVDAIDVPVDAFVEMEPGGLHLMLFGVQPLAVGDEVAMTLTFETAGPIEVVAIVEDAATHAAHDHDHHHDHDH